MSEAGGSSISYPDRVCGLRNKEFAGSELG
jgi:hypothetical protein